MIWIALVIFIIGFLIFQEVGRHNRKMEELKQKDAHDKQKLEEEKLKANPKYTKLKSLQNEISENRRLYIINQRYGYELESEILDSEDGKKKKLQKDLVELKKSQDSLQKECGKLMRELEAKYGSEGQRGIDWSDDLREENTDSLFKLLEKKRGLSNDAT